MKSAAKKKRRRLLMRRKRSLDPNLVIEYKNPDVLKRFITDRGKIIPRRISGATAEQQRKITLAIKRARFLSLIPSSSAHEMEKGFAGEMQAVAQAFSSATTRGGGAGRTGKERERNGESRGQSGPPPEKMKSPTAKSVEG